MPRRKKASIIPDIKDLPPGTPVASYYRDSGGRAQELSIPQQDNEATAFIAGLGWQKFTALQDAGKSGTDPSRKGLQDLLALLNERPLRIQAVVVWSYSRLARDEGIGFLILGLCRQVGVPIVSVTEPIPPELRGIMEPLLLWQAAMQSKKISEDTARGLANMMSRGYAPGGFPPVGFKVEYVEAGKHRDGTSRRWPLWVPDPELHDPVALALKMRLSGASNQAILAATKFFTNQSSLPTFFGNPVYCGFPHWYLNHNNLTVTACLELEPVVEPYVGVPDWLRLQERKGARPGGEFDPRREFVNTDEKFPKITDVKFPTPVGDIGPWSHPLSGSELESEGRSPGSWNTPALRFSRSR